MEKRLFFRWGLMCRAITLSIDKGVQDAIPVLANGAQAAFARHNKAAMAAQPALTFFASFVSWNIACFMARNLP